MFEYMDINNVIEDEQNGFRKNRSCEGHIYAVISLQIQSADRIFVFLSTDKHHFVDRLKLLHVH